MAPSVTGRAVGALRADGTRPFVIRYTDPDAGSGTILTGKDLPWEYGKTVVIKQIILEHDGTAGVTVVVRLYTNSAASGGDQMLLKKICAQTEEVFQWDVYWPYNEAPTRGGSYLVASFTGQAAGDDCIWTIAGDVIA